MEDDKKPTEENKKFDAQTFFSSTYIKSIAQIDFLKEIAPNVINENMDWVSERRAQTLFFKTPDLLVFDKNNQIIWEATKRLHQIIQERNLTEELFYVTAEKLCHNDLQETNAHLLWTIDVDSTKTPYANLVERSDIVSLTTNTIDNTIIDCIIRKLIYEKNGTKFYLVEHREENKISTEIGHYDAENKFKQDKNSEIPETIKKIYESKIGKHEWNYPIKPFEYIKNKPNLKADINLIKSNLQKEIMLTGQEYIEIAVSGTKVVLEKGSSQNPRKRDDQKNDHASAMMIASQPTLEITKRPLPGQNPSPQIAYGQSQSLETYDRLRKTNKNEMLQKIGAATDVDSKGTVQQTQSELLQTRGDEYKTTQWKNSHFQAKIQNLMHKFATILKQEKDADFKDYDRVQVFLATNEVISENDLIKNLSEAVKNGFISEELAIARFNKINLYEAHELLELRKRTKIQATELGETDGETTSDD